VPRRGLFARIRGFFRSLVQRAPEPPVSTVPEEPTRRYLPAGGFYDTQFSFFMDLPGMDEEDEDTIDYLWDSYQRNMLHPRHRYRIDDPRNPFWSDIGMHPSNFDWQEFRRVYGGTSHGR